MNRKSERAAGNVWSSLLTIHQESNQNKNHQMKIIVFDTETTGKPKNYKAPMNDVENWPRVIQVAWQVQELDHKDSPVRYSESLVKPDGWVIPQEKFWIDHGFSTERNIVHGKPIGDLLDQFLNDLAQCDLMLAHNIEFDYNVLGAEMIRAGKKSSRKVPRFCTMNNQVIIDYVKAKFAGATQWSSRNCGYKWPTLTELYKKVFDTEMENAHDAQGDVTACRLCFIELVNRKIINPFN